jgi:putative ABC transport system permease protein
VIGRTLHAVSTVVAEIVFGLVTLAALTLSGTRIGRFLAAVSLPRLRLHRLRTTLTVLGVSLGVAVLVAVVVLNRSIIAGFTATVDEISGKADFEVVGKAGSIDESILDAVRAVAAVDKATPMVQEIVAIRAKGAEGQRLMIIGVDFISEEGGDFRAYDSADIEAVREDPIAFMNSRTHIIIGRALADRMGWKVGDAVPLLTPAGVQDFTIWGFVGSAGLGRAFGGSMAVMYYQAMQVTFARGNNIDRVDVRLRPGTDASATASDLTAKLGAGYTVQRPERRGDKVEKMLAGLRMALTMGSLLALFVGMFLIYNTMSISVVQRRRDIGILRALGITRGQILRLIVLEGALLGAAGGAAGVVIGIGLSRLMLDRMGQTVSELYLQVATTRLQIDPALLAAAFVLGVVASVLSSLIPAYEATAVQPIETLRTGPAGVTAPGAAVIRAADVMALCMFAVAAVSLQIRPTGAVPVGGYLACGSVLIGVALLAPRVIALLHRALRPGIGRILGVVGTIAIENLPRDIRRAAITASALMVGVSMATSFAGFVGSMQKSLLDWIDQTVPADIFITSAARFGGVQNVPMEDGLQEELRALPGVLAVERVRFADLDCRGSPVKLASVEVEVFAKHASATYLKGDREEARKLMMQGLGVVVSDNFANKYDVAVGDTLELGTTRGSHPFQLAGIIVDYTSDLGTIIMDRAAYIQHFRDTRVDTFKIFMQDRADAGAMQRLVQSRFGEKYNL